MFKTRLDTFCLDGLDISHSFYHRSFHRGTRSLLVNYEDPYLSYLTKSDHSNSHIVRRNSFASSWLINYFTRCWRTESILRECEVICAHFELSHEKWTYKLRYRETSQCCFEQAGKLFRTTTDVLEASYVTTKWIVTILSYLTKSEHTNSHIVRWTNVASSRLINYFTPLLTYWKHPT
jgi:hypothetical protein